MAALTLDAEPLRPPPKRDLRRALLLAGAMHVLLVLVLTLNLRWQNASPPAVQAELWSPIAQPAAAGDGGPPTMAATPVEAHPQVEPEPAPVPEPDEPAQARAALAQQRAAEAAEQKAAQALALKAARAQAQKEAKAQALAAQREAEIAAQKQAKAEALREAKLQAQKEAKAKAKAEAEAHKKEAEAEARRQAKLKALQEAAAQKQAKAEADKKAKQQADKEAKLQAQKQAQAQSAAMKQARDDYLQNMMKQAGGARGAGGSSPVSAGPSDGYSKRIGDLIKQKVIFPQLDQIDGNPKVKLMVTLNPATGEVLGAKVSQGSGVPSWDQAVLRAVNSVGRLPSDRGRWYTPMEVTAGPRDRP